MPLQEQNFDHLKKEIADTFRKTYPSCKVPIEEWKGQDIENFQEELITKVKGRISEKWFYTHIKSKSDKLPRIDMLNMLSQYAGYADWRDFTNQKNDFTKEIEIEHQIITSNPITIDPEKEIKPEIATPAISNKSKKPIGWIISAIAILTIGLFFIFKGNTKTYRCFFTDFNGHTLLSNSKIEVHLLKRDESPISIPIENTGYFEIKTSDDHVKFIVNAPYYKTDTITRFIDEPFMEEQIKLKTNDYALMIHCFSTSGINDWKQRRTQLDDMIAMNAKIFQVYSDGSGMELYNKEEFINKLTMPLNSLKNIDIIETRYSGNQIALLRFIQTEPSK
jgi:hypothetical protein